MSVGEGLSVSTSGVWCRASGHAGLLHRPCLEPLEPRKCAGPLALPLGSLLVASMVALVARTGGSYWWLVARTRGIPGSGSCGDGYH